MAVNRLVLVAVLMGFCSVLFLACSGGNGGPDGNDGGELDAGDGGGDEGPPPMQVGEISEVLPDAQGVISTEIATPDGNESYILVLYSAAWETGKEYGYAVTVTPPPGGGILKTTGLMPSVQQVTNVLGSFIQVPKSPLSIKVRMTLWMSSHAHSQSKPSGCLAR